MAKSTNSQNSDFLQRAFLPSAEDGCDENQNCEEDGCNGDDDDDDEDCEDDDGDDYDDDDDEGYDDDKYLPGG